MRLLVDTLIALMLVGILVGVLLYHRQRTAELRDIALVHQSLAMLHEQAIYHGALQPLNDPQDGGQAAQGENPMPATISLAWFGLSIPVNPLAPVLSGDQPWLDLAPPGDSGDHPPDPVITRPTQAAFWYNPARGIFRARIGPQFSNTQALTLYNRLNQTALQTLPTGNDSQRKPVPLIPPRRVRSSEGSAIEVSGQGSQRSSADGSSVEEAAPTEAVARPSLLTP